MDEKLKWDIQSRFAEIVCRALGVDDAHVQAKRCPDVYVGRLCDIPPRAALPKERWRFAASDTARVSRPDMQCVVLVLESPHADEYNAHDELGSYTPWPANGATGGTIQRRALELAAALNVAPESGLVLLNAIPYQCSQGSDGGPSVWKARRDEIFAFTWNQGGGKELFRARLRHWVQNGDVLVNACTAGKSGNPKLRDLVEQELADYCGFSEVRRCRMHHPAAWKKSSLIDHMFMGA